MFTQFYSFMEFEISPFTCRSTTGFAAPYKICLSLQPSVTVLHLQLCPLNPSPQPLIVCPSVSYSLQLCTVNLTLHACKFMCVYTGHTRCVGQVKGITARHVSGRKGRLEGGIVEVKRKDDEGR